MGFLKFFLTMSWIVLASDAQAAFKGFEINSQTAAGPNDNFILGGAAELQFDTGRFDIEYMKQYSKVAFSDPNSPLQATDSWRGGFSQLISDHLSMGIEYDDLNDLSDALSAKGIKATTAIEPFTFSFREARTVIDESLTYANHVYQGAFVYQSTLEASVDLELGENDVFTPDVAYSFFNPDLANFQKILGIKQKKRYNLTSINSNFQGTLQAFENWAAKLTYTHTYPNDWSAIFTATVANLILGENPLVDLNPAVSHDWNERWSTELGYDYLYIPGTPSWTFDFEIKYKFQVAEKDENSFKRKL